MSTVETETKTKSPPIHKIVVGATIASIWHRVTESGQSNFNTTVVRVYKDKHNEYAESNNYFDSELLELSKAADLAHTWITDRQAEERAKRRG